MLEYLIRRFLIHEFNTNALLKCMLVAHDTKVSPFMSESVHDPLTIFRYSEVSCNSVRLKKADGLFYPPIKKAVLLFRAII